MITQGRIDLFLGRPYEDYVATLLANTTFFTKNMVVVYASKTQEHIERPGLEESNSKQQEGNGSNTINLCTSTKTAQEDAPELLRRKNGEA